MTDKPQGYAHLTAEISKLRRELAAVIEQRDKLAEALRSCMNGIQATADHLDSRDVPCGAYHAVLKQAHEALKECGK